MREIHVANGFNLGDSVFLVHYLRKACEMNDDIMFYCHIKDPYFGEINKQIDTFKDRIILKSLKDLPKEFTNGWYGAYGGYIGGHRDGVYYLNERYHEFFEYLSNTLQIKNPIVDKCGTVMDNPLIAQDIHKDFDGYDILMINSVPLSGQYIYNEPDFVYKINEFKDKYKIITTKKVDIPDVLCTTDYNLDLLQIGKVSTKVKYIIGIATAPIINCFNKWNIDTVKKWVVLSKRSSYSYNNRIIKKFSVKQLTMDELEA